MVISNWAFLVSNKKNVEAVLNLIKDYNNFIMNKGIFGEQIEITVLVKYKVTNDYFLEVVSKGNENFFNDWIGKNFTNYDIVNILYPISKPDWYYDESQSEVFEYQWVNEIFKM